MGSCGPVREVGVGVEGLEDKGEDEGVVLRGDSFGAGSLSGGGISF